MRLVGISEAGNIVSMDITHQEEKAITIEYTSKNNSVIDSFEKDITLQDALSKIKLVLCNEAFGL